MARAGARQTSPSPSPAATLHAQPTDVALLNDFLRPWVTSGDTKAAGAGAGGGAYVHAADLYSADPEELTRRFQPAVSMDGDHVWYFLSPLRTKSPRDRRKVRAVADGTGCWHSEAAPKNVVDQLDGGRHVGYRQSFSFMRRGDAAGAGDLRSGWIMAEFHLHHDGLGTKVEGLVLCKVYRSPRNRGGTAAPDDDNADADVVSSVSLFARAPAPHDNADADAVSSASLSTKTTTPSCTRSNAGDGEDSNNAATPSPSRQGENSNADTPSRRHTENPNAVAMAMPIAEPVSSAATTAVVPLRKEKAVELEVVVVDDDDDSFVSPPPPARKKMRTATTGTDISRAASARKVKAAGATSAAAHLHCPQCGFHLAALQALVTLTNCMSGVHRRRVGEFEMSRRFREGTNTPWGHALEDISEF